MVPDVQWAIHTFSVNKKNKIHSYLITLRTSVWSAFWGSPLTKHGWWFLKEMKRTRGYWEAIISFNLYKNAVLQIWLSPFHRWRSWASKMLNTFVRVTQPKNDGGQIWFHLFTMPRGPSLLQLKAPCSYSPPSPITYTPGLLDLIYLILDYNSRHILNCHYRLWLPK